WTAPMAGESEVGMRLEDSIFSRKVRELDSEVKGLTRCGLRQPRGGGTSFMKVMSDARPTGISGEDGRESEAACQGRGLAESRERMVSARGLPAWGKGLKGGRMQEFGVQNVN
ncbi:MAG: hypothetical protein OEZ02_08085, partial [Anaerolineae bacterium]|nr:hypothetical protein [Anaerolineae bacterium]